MHCFVGGWGGRIFLEKILIETGLDRENAIEKQQNHKSTPRIQCFLGSTCIQWLKKKAWKNPSKEKTRANLWCETWHRTMIFNYIEMELGDNQMMNDPSASPIGTPITSTDPHLGCENGPDSSRVRAHYKKWRDDMPCMNFYECRSQFLLESRKQSKSQLINFQNPYDNPLYRLVLREPYNGLYSIIVG